MASDDLSTRLEEANAHFLAKSYDMCLKVLSSCPQDDPRVIHSTAICNYAKAPFNHRALLAKLDLPPPQRGKSLKPNAPVSVPHIVLQYEGQELAYLNAAMLHLHNGAVSEARSILNALAPLGTNFPPNIQVRIAMLLHITTRRLPGSDATEIIESLMAREKETQQDAALTQMLTLAFSDTSMLHNWFNRSPRSSAEQTLYFNNLGVEAFANGKCAVASVFFARAAKAVESLTTSVSPLVTSSVFYNLAVCALARGSANDALPSLLKAQSTMSGSPVLWIRLAQALLSGFHNEAHDEAISEYTKKIIAYTTAVFSRGCQRGVAPLPPHQYAVSKTRGAPLLTAAALCLQTAQSLLIEKDRLVDAAKRLVTSPETAHLLDATLCMMAYVELCRGNHGVVIAIANEYFIIERDVPAATTSRTQAVMACYNVEALCLTNRSSQALRVLQSMNLGSLIARGMPNAVMEAMMTNLTVAYIMNGQWVKALELAKQLTPRLASPYSQLIEIYLDLAQGNTQGANEIVESIPQRFLKAGSK